MILTRKINLGKYGLQFESLDIATNDYPTFKECHDEYMTVLKEINEGLTKNKKKVLDELNLKQSLNKDEQKIMDDLNKIMGKTSLPPF